MDKDIAVRITKESYELAKKMAKKQDRSIKTIVKLAINEMYKNQPRI